MRVRVLGAGIVGLACADELLRRGHDVTVVDPRPGAGASHVAAGMLTPGAEAWYGEEETFALGVESAALWPSYASRLGVELDTVGTLLVGRDAGDADQVVRRGDLLRGWGRDVAVLSGAEVRRREPTLARVQAGLLLSDRAVDPRTVLASLTRRLAGRVVPAAADDPTAPPEVTVVATGHRLPPPHTALVRGVRGEILVLRPGARVPRHVVRGWVAGEEVYVVPRADGRLVVGATSEEHDGEARVTAGGVLRLLRAARVLLPCIDRAELLETSARNRPATPDHLPVVGPGFAPGQWVVGGAFRHGVLLAPLLARLLADSVEGAAPRPALDPGRFHTDPVRPTEEKQCT